ncbi:MULTISPECIES: hypothetical protein [Pandoraea]|uniref:hypothetical protein n=1 Tax=Pandoraea TaxID=93217 RepID=UPI001F5C9EF2|nr:MULTISPECIES: hypothetical protein [Pandoraea]MCI3206431.1 hypothetical protein [Pandoraea sp. LA3]MDN4584459.1 hypothetical protein [Pandoraea capi]
MKSRDSPYSINGLTAAQVAHVAKVFPECREDMAKYLISGAEVLVVQQDEVHQALPQAIVVIGTAFWVDCCDTRAEAVNLAESLGLVVLGR